MRRLETTTDLLDALQERYGWTSDRQISAGLDIPSATVSGWRSGRMYPTEVHALTLAEALEIPPAMVLVIAAADRTPDRKARERWQEILRQVARTGVGALAAVLVGSATYSPPAEAEDAGCGYSVKRRRRPPAHPQAA